ncbi:MAG: preprotein translocase subunit SecA [Candidatus Nanopelagicales bacterium]|nr:preprotein translocase subunit SecA [Candidatus Nanopelagicales bacterium]
MELFNKILRAGEGKILRRLKAITQQVNSLEPDFETLSDAELKAMTAQFRERLAEGETLDELLPEAFATVREAARRTLGQRHYDVQIMGGAALHLGNIAEMKTGEGKTLVSTLPAYLNALPGGGVHIITVNDYLAERDSEWMGRVHRFLGLEVGCILSELTPPQRRVAYAADITYGTNNEFGFDYLRDNMAWSTDEMVQRGHSYAIVDEVDSILIDEARTPLIISGPADQSPKWYADFAKLVRRLESDRDYEVDPKKRTVGILEEGVERTEDWLGIDNLYETVNTSLVGFLNNAIKAKELFKRDKDYVIMDGEVLIVDEHTGRILSGRRYNEGLHQAIEAKEGVEIKAENQTLATITLQNFFRLYSKLSGMTGTAMTEAAEFNQIYKIGVVPIPTNQPNIRQDRPDLVYRSEDAKFLAVVDDIAERNELGQPILVGTTSVEKSELLSGMLRRAGVKHEVLNAKNHHREAAIIAEAGRRGSVTVATNMAGRGTDIMLGGNPEVRAAQELARRGLSPADTPEEYEQAWPEALADQQRAVSDEHGEVVDLGGLYVLGTERHESRRIDNQLRGRSARQGDPGETRFYLSLNDELMRRFNAGLVEAFLSRFNVPDDVPIEAKMVTRAIQSAQSQVEAQNFEIRKNVLKYDEVLNRQRLVIYGERHRVLEGEDLQDQIRTFIDDAVVGAVTQATLEGYPEEWDLDVLWTQMRALYPISVEVEDLEERAGGGRGSLSREYLIEELQEDIQQAYDAREETLGAEVLRELERRVVLSVLDRKWREHLYEMDYLQEGIGLRAMAQRDPLVEYQREGFDLFQGMMDSIKEEVVGYLFNVDVTVTGEDTEEEPPEEDESRPALSPDAAGAPDRETEPGKHHPHVAAPGLTPERPAALQYTAPAEDGTVQHSAARANPVGASVDGSTPVAGGSDGEPGYANVSRNAPCPCGSGRKYKRCHGDPRSRGRADSVKPGRH